MISASSLDETRQRLNDTRIFRSVDLRLAPVDGREDVRDVVIDVVERSDINVEYSLRYTTAGEAQVGGAPSETQAGVQVGAGLELVNQRSLGPRSLEGEAIGGQASAIFNQELRFPLWKRLHGGIFYDAGNAFALARELDLRDLRQSAGAGLRLMFPFGPVRVDWAHVLDARAGETPSRFVFSIGHAF